METSVADAAFEGQQCGFGARDELGGAQRVTVVAGVGLDNDGAGAVGEGEVEDSAVR